MNCFLGDNELDQMLFVLFEIHGSFNKCPSLRSKCFQSSCCAKVRAGAKNTVEGGGGGEKRKRLPANPTILENAL